MAEYIKREDAINLLHYHADEVCSAVVADFESIPAADVAPEVQTHFIDGECTNCGWFGDCVETLHYRYCPHCGAKADGTQ